MLRKKWFAVKLKLLNFELKIYKEILENILSLVDGKCNLS